MSGWVEAFIVIAAVAIVIQTLVMAAMAIQMRSSMQHLTRVANDLHARIDPILGFA